MPTSSRRTASTSSRSSANPRELPVFLPFRIQGRVTRPSDGKSARRSIACRSSSCLAAQDVDLEADPDETAATDANVAPSEHSADAPAIRAQMTNVNAHDVRMR